MYVSSLVVVKNAAIQLRRVLPVDILVMYYLTQSRLCLTSLFFPLLIQENSLFDKIQSKDVNEVSASSIPRF